MPDTMIVRLATVLAGQAAERRGKDAATASSFAVAAWPDYVDSARAVLAAMATPTEAMLDAATLAVLSRDARGTWRAMIDTAFLE
jgi:2-methylisocitrate lyase-like PEP mutase family enzyme